MGSGGLKKVAKVVSKFSGSAIADPLGLNKIMPGITSPIESLLAGKAGPLDGLTGAGAARNADNLARTQMEIANQQATQAQQEARDAADSNILSIRGEITKDQASKAAADLSTVDESKVNVDLADSGNNSSTRRKKYSTSSVTTGGAGGPAIRI